MSAGSTHAHHSPKGFQEVFTTYFGSLRNFLYYKCGDLQQAEDLAQEAMVRLWNNRQKVEPGKIKSYLFTVANNLFLDLARHQQVKLKFSSRPQKDRSQEDPQYLMEEQEFKGRLESAINDLPEGQREVFLMNRIDELTYKEIAERLGVTQKAVEKRMSKAIRALKEKLSRKI